MHELSIAAAILDQLEQELTKRPGACFRKVGVRIGDLAGVDSDCLTFGFDSLVKDTHWEPLVMEIERVRRRQRCPECKYEFEAENWATACSQCGTVETATIAGEELQIAYIEVDE